LAELLRRFPDAGGAERILSFSPRPFSAASVVSTPHGNVFVKRHHESVRNEDELKEEHNLLRYVREHSSLIPRVLADEHGETSIRKNQWIYEVHDVAAGLDLYEHDLSWTPFRNVVHARAAGRALAQLHLATAGYQASPRKTKTLVGSFSIFAANDPWSMLERYVEQRPALADYLIKQDWRAQVEATLLPYYSRLHPQIESLNPLWTHNDFHASNLFWSSDSDGASVRSIIDFGLADRTNAIHDLAIAIERNGIRWLALDGSFAEVVHLDQILALLNGYVEIRPLSISEVRALPVILPLVHAEFALSETDYYLRVLKSDQRAPFAWDGYFLGHAAWFGSDNGRRLLDQLSAWADSITTPERQVEDVHP
jgi:Ser/Thr protein kinase RdoA (MazF antagonist)